MNTKTFFCSILCCFYVISCNNHEHDHDHDHDHHSEQNDHDGHEHDAEHQEGEIILEPEIANELGVKTATIVEAPFCEVISVSGRIESTPADEAVVSASTPGIIHFNSDIFVGAKVKKGQPIARISAQAISGGDPNASAKVALSAAKKELERLKPLLADGIVTQREYNAALATYESAKAAYSPTAAAGVVTSPITGVITNLTVASGSFVEPSSVIAQVSSNSSLTIRAELPEKYRKQMASISSALIRTPYSENWIDLKELNGQRINSSGASVQSVSGYLPIYFSINNDGSLSAGSYIDINLLGSDSVMSIVVPCEAITEQQAVYFVYQKTGEHSYKKSRINPGMSDGKNTQVLSGVKSGDEIVVSGAIMVKLAEANGAVPEGHSHTH